MLVITFSVQAGKQVVPGPAELGQPEFPWTCILLYLPQHPHSLPPPLQWGTQVIASALPAQRVGNHHQRLYPSQGGRGFHRLLVKQGEQTKVNLLRSFLP